MYSRRKITWVCLIGVAILIKVFAYFPDTVEKYYSRGLYPIVSRLQRALFGWVPFSVGDLLYGVVVVVALRWIILSVRTLIRREAGSGWLLRGGRKVAFAILWVYVLFNLEWGLNYNRLGIADQLQLNVKPYTTGELQTLTDVLLAELNRLDSVARLHRTDLRRMATLRSGAVRSYDSLAVADPRFAYRGVSVKASLFSYPGVYIGFAGYYNPFTGEAQVNTMDPLFGLPYTTCHEMGHQLGYAKENEANFIGFLAARSSADPAFSYSAYLDLFLYSFRELRFRDSVLAKTYKGRLGPGVRADLLEQERFNRRYSNDLAPGIWALYGSYLKANRQPHGIVTYTEVTAWLISYANQRGWDALKWGGAR
ncbi:MAG TPA: DUF3810 domain-containing protein [Puia sp.]|nr:DUF3810 domain-containing protein [Puia sp.]